MLRFDGQKDFPRHSPAALWDKLSDARFLVQCVPDVHEVSKQERQEAEFTLRPGFAFVRGTLHVSLKVVEAVSPSSVRVALLSKGIGSSSEVEAAMTLTALENGQVGYLGLDVYEPEDDLVFKDHKPDAHTDPLLKKLLEHPNVLITPHQACLTRETLQEIADRTIKNLDMWQQDKCAGDACVCHKSAKPAKDDHLLNG